MPDERYYKTMFTVGGVWNWAAALLSVAMAAMDWPILNLFLKMVPESFLWYHLYRSKKEVIQNETVTI